jgi:protein SCO1/2
LTITFLVLVAASKSVCAQVNQVPAAGRGIEANDSLLGEFVPTDIKFYDEQNNVVQLGDYLKKGRPVMLSFNYSNCPQLCHTQLSNMTFALKDIRLVPGRDFEIVSISMDHLEQTSRARQTKEKYLTLFDRMETANGWHFLTGKRENIRAMADAVGVRYRYIPKTKSYSHSAVFVMISPKGKIVRYVYGLDFEPKTLELALTEAGQGKIGSPINQGFLLTGCFVFDEFTGKYTMKWMGLMRIGGILTALGVFIWLVPMMVRYVTVAVFGSVIFVYFAITAIMGSNWVTLAIVLSLLAAFLIFCTFLIRMEHRKWLANRNKNDKVVGVMPRNVQIMTSGETDV